MRLAMATRDDDVRLVLIDDSDRWYDALPALEAARNAGLAVDPVHHGASIAGLLRHPDVPGVLAWLASKGWVAPVEDQDTWTLLAPDPGGEIFCVGRNYAAHAAELGNEVPGEPLLFQKPRHCLVGPDARVHRPKSERVDYEGELALVIGRDLNGLVSDEDARSAVVAVTLFNDITDRAAQQKAKEKGKPWFRAKGGRGFGPLGPVLRYVASDEPLAGFSYETRLNGETVQQGDPRLWLWPAEALVKDLALAVGLRRGDLIATGTPAGVGPLQEEDVVELVCDRIGTLRTTIVGETIA